jgi:hypothetical protein
MRVTILWVSEERYDGTLEYVREKIAVAVGCLDDTSRPLQARIESAGLILTMASFRESDFRGNWEAWKTYGAFREMTTTQEHERLGSVTMTAAMMSHDQAAAAATLLRELAEEVGPPDYSSD